MMRGDPDAIAALCPDVPVLLDEDGPTQTPIHGVESEQAMPDRHAVLSVTYNGTTHTFPMSPGQDDETAIGDFLEHAQVDVDSEVDEAAVRGCSCGQADYGAPGHDGHMEVTP